MDWNLFCPKCCCVVDSFRSLKSVHNNYHCAFCATDYEAALDEYIAIAFTVSHEIRNISFHDPLQLPAWDYFYQVRNTADGVLPDGVPLITVKGTMTRAVSWIPAGQTTSVRWMAPKARCWAPPPTARLASRNHRRRARGLAAGRQYSLWRSDGDIRDAPGRARQGRLPHRERDLRAGLVCIAQLPPGFDINTIPLKFVPFLNGKRVLTTQDLP